MARLSADRVLINVARGGASFCCDFDAELFGDGSCHFSAVGPVLAMYDHSKRTHEVNKLIRSWRKTLHVHLMLVGLSFFDVVFPPTRAVRWALVHGGALRMTDRTRSTWTMTATCLLVFCMAVVMEAKIPNRRLRAEGVFGTLCSIAVTFLSFVPLYVAALGQNRDCCSEGAVDNVCVHMQVELAAVCDAAADRNVSEHVLRLLKAAWLCPAARGTLAELLRDFGKRLHDNVPTCGLFTNAPLRTSGRAAIAGRKRNSTQMLKDELAHGLAEKQLALSGGSTAKVFGIDKEVFRWSVAKDCIAMVARNQRSFGVPGTYSCAQDAARLGNPAKETKTYAVYSHVTRESTWMPNQVLVATYGPRGGKQRWPASRRAKINTKKLVSPRGGGGPASCRARKTSVKLVSPRGGAARRQGSKNICKICFPKGGVWDHLWIRFCFGGTSETTSAGLMSVRNCA